jgi:hypothetical protein
MEKKKKQKEKGAASAVIVYRMGHKAHRCNA